MSDPGTESLEGGRGGFEEFQQMAAQVVQSPRLYDALRDLDDPTRFAEGSKDPHKYLAEYDVFVRADAEVVLYHSSPGCVEVTLFGNRLRVCL